MDKRGKGKRKGKKGKEIKPVPSTRFFKFAIARAGLSPFGQTEVQLRIVWHLNNFIGESRFCSLSFWLASLESETHL